MLPTPRVIVPAKVLPAIAVYVIASVPIKTIPPLPVMVVEATAVVVLVFQIEPVPVPDTFDRMYVPGSTPVPVTTIPT